MLKVISKECGVRSWNVAETQYKSLIKSLQHDANLVRHTISFMKASDTKCSASATREVDTVSQITA